MGRVGEPLEVYPSANHTYLVPKPFTAEHFSYSSEGIWVRAYSTSWLYFRSRRAVSKTERTNERRYSSSETWKGSRFGSQTSLVFSPSRFCCALFHRPNALNKLDMSFFYICLMICPLKVGKVSEFTTHKRNIDAWLSLVINICTNHPKIQLVWLSGYFITSITAFGVEKTNILIAVDNSSVWFYIIISADNTKLPCYILPPTQHHSFSRNLTPLFSSSVCCVTQRDRKSVTMIFALLERRGCIIFSARVDIHTWLRRNVFLN